jgi:hypothetical protein
LLSTALFTFSLRGGFAPRYLKRSTAFTSLLLLQNPAIFDSVEVLIKTPEKKYLDDDSFHSFMVR